jgi:hypothetical protein
LLQIYASPNANGPHHMMMIYPFVHVLVACAFYAVIVEKHPIQTGPVWLKWPYTILGISGLLLIIGTNLLVDARYLTSFAREGGRGVWSAAIYELADYAREHDEQTYVLMDWGFNTQMLLLSRGTIDRREVFWSLLDGRSEAEHRDTLYAWAQNSSATFVFHTPAYTIFDPPQQLFHQMLLEHGLHTEVVRVFNEGSGAPVYSLERVIGVGPDPVVAAPCVIERQAEAWDTKSGGTIDYKAAAVGGAALGGFWGLDTSDFVGYQFVLPKAAVNQASLFLSIATDALEPRDYRIFLDDVQRQVLTVHPTGGWGNTADEWAEVTVNLGSISAGTHHLTIRPSLANSVVNIDHWRLCDGEAAFPK